MAAFNPVQSSTNLFRRLTWQSSIPISVRLADDELRGGSSVDRYYMQAPRYTYLPLLIPEIRENLVELALDEQQLIETNEREWWFEEEEEESSRGGGGGGEKDGQDAGGRGGFTGQGACRWHWPLDLIELHSIISHPYGSEPSSSKPRILRLILHLSTPPQDKLLMPNTIEACKTQFVNQLKEADFVRWRNTNKVTNIRRSDLEAGWDGIVQDDYDLFMRMASRLLPLPLPPAATPPALSNIPSRPPSTDPGNSGPSKPESSYTAKAIPIKVFLPDGAPVIQEVIPPLLPNGKAQTIIGVLQQHLPLLFPSTSDSSTSPYPLAVPLIQGIEVPPDAEVAWLSACLCGVDGWLRVGIQLRAD